jgi:glycine betaine/proline transport system substrate-binding protein
MRNRLFYILSLSLALILVLAACGGGGQQTETEPTEAPGEAETMEEPAPEGEMEEDMEEPAPEGEMEEDMEEPAPEGEMEEGDDAGAMPGEGTTVEMARATWTTGWFQAAIYEQLLEEMGYEISQPSELGAEVFYVSAAEGDVDFWPNGWFPLHNTFIQQEDVQGNVEQVGFQVEAGALQGYLVDKATADELGVTSLEDFTRPEVVEAFDSDGDGLANLTGCNPGWGCEAVIEHHLDAYELRDYVQHVQGTYAALMAETISRYEDGEPIFFYTWTPNWTIAELVPAEDVVWIGVPFPSLPEDQADLEDQTVAEGVEGCVAEPCDMGFPPNDIRVVANTEFLGNNPSAAQLFELVVIPLQDIADQNVKMQEGEDSEEDIQRHASEWIEANRDQVDQWLEEARAAAGTTAEVAE